MNTPSTILVRIGCVAVALGLWFWTQKLISRKAQAGDGIGDRLHDWTAGWNSWLLAHPKAANAVLIATSGLIDAFGLYVVTYSVLGPTLRPFVALLLVFSLRQACQGLCTLPFPKGTIWRHPGFPSLLVTYGTSNDFFFSGHTSIAVVGAMELVRGGPPWLGVFAVLVAGLEALTVIVLRAHYTMDVVAAVFAAWCCDGVAAQLAPLVDGWLAR